MNQPEASLQLNVAQYLLAVSKAKETYLEIGRGGGKSTGIGLRIKDIVGQMPRSKNGIVGETYQQLLTRTLPSTIEGLELLGYKKDLPYFVGKKPPSSWKWNEAYQPPLDHDRYISFYNGTGFQLISLENPDSGRGLNLDGVIGDEAALMDKEKLANNVLSANRGNIDRFDHTWLHHSVLFASSTPLTIKGRWFVDQEQESNRLRNPNKMVYIKAPATCNAHNLGPDFFKLNKRIMTELQYNAEILCIRPGKVDNGFYALLNENTHTYLSTNENYLFSLNYDIEELKKETCLVDGDLNKSAIIDIAFDWGAKINTLVCGQQNGDLYKIINAMFVKSPQLATDLAHKFCDYYSGHHHKYVNFYYDHTANYRTATNPITFAEEVIKVIRGRGWKVNPIYCGQAPSHHSKFLFWGIILKETNPRMPKFRMNRNNCKYLIVSMQQAGVMEGAKGFEKDKRPERRQGVVDEETTHFSDALDTLVFFKFHKGLKTQGYVI